MKKILLITTVLLSVIILVCFIYFNSDSYKYLLADQRRSSNLSRLNKINRIFAEEGVYSFDSYKTIYTNYINQFGENVSASQDEYYGRGSVSFRSSKIILLLSGKKEEIEVGQPVISETFFSENFIHYYFPIIKWNAYDEFGFCFFNFDSIENHWGRDAARRSGAVYIQPTLVLSAENKLINGNKQGVATIKVMSMNALKFSNKPSQTISLNDYRNPPEEFSNVSNLDDFKIVPFRINYGRDVKMDNLEYKYDNSNRFPRYAEDAIFEPKVYDINLYLKRLKYSNPSNPFIIKKLWNK